jgi:hypothetical protein
VDGVRSCNHAFLNPPAEKTNAGLQDLTACPCSQGDLLGFADANVAATRPRRVGIGSQQPDSLVTTGVGAAQCPNRARPLARRPQRADRDLDLHLRPYAAADRGLRQ